MIRRLEPVRAELARRPSRWFFRDDDAGWDDARLLAVVDVFRAAGEHVDLAAIPAATSPDLGRRLGRIVEEGIVSVHQHGWAHLDHERHGRRCEFGPSRAAAAQRVDLVRGRRVLAERLEGRVDPFFTPPWNRCTDATAALLAELGFSLLSADRSAPTRHVPDLAEIPVAVDWSRAWSRGGPTGLAAELREALAPTRPGGEPAVGVMLHHAVMEADELEALGDLLRLLGGEPAAAVASLGALLDERTLTHASSTSHAATAR